MISNLPTLTTRNVTVEIDAALAEHQLSRITDILQCKDYHLSTAERAALDGVRNLLAAMTNTELTPPRATAKRIAHEDVNRIRDLCMLGKSTADIAERFGYRRLAVQRLRSGQTYADVPYEPSEFATGVDMDKLAGTDAYPWTKTWKGGNRA